MKKIENIPWFQYVKQNYQDIAIGYDPNLLSALTVETKSQYFAENKIEFMSINDNLIDKIWLNKPLFPKDKVLN